MFKTASTLGLGNVVSLLLSFISLKLSVSILSINEFGMFGYWMGLFGLAFVFVDAGFGGAHLKRISEGEDSKDCFRVYSTVSAFILFAFVIVVVTVMQVWGPRIVGIYDAHYLPSFYLLYAAWNMTMLYQDVGRSFIGLSLPLKQVLTELSRNMTLVMLLLGVLIYRGGFIHLAAAYMISASVGLLISLWLSRFLWGGRWSFGLLKSYLSYGSTHFFSVAVQAAAKNLDVIIVGTYLGKPDLAIYYGSKRLVSFAEPLSSALFMSGFPIISSLSAKNDLSGIRNTISRLERATALAVAPMFGIVFWFAPSILTLILGSNYSSQSYVFVGLFACMTVSIVGLGYTFAPAAMGRPGIAFRNAALALVGWLILSFILVPDQVLGIRTLGIGLTGIVLASLLYWIIWTVLDRLVLRKWVGTRFSFEVLGLVLLGVISASISRLLVPTGNTLIQIILFLTFAVLVTICIYFALLLVFRILHLQDLIVLFRKTKAMFQGTMLFGREKAR